jgi:hypothetical protein
MKELLSIRSDLDHDGDGLVRFRLSAENAEFRAATQAWGSEESVRSLLSAVDGFPRSVPDRAEFTFGSPRSGVCHLEFQTTDGRGHCRVWVSVEAADGSAGSERHQRSTICVEFLPADLDEFCDQLRRFKPGRDNEALLTKSKV